MIEAEVTVSISRCLLEVSASYILAPLVLVIGRGSSTSQLVKDALL